MPPANHTTVRKQKANSAGHCVGAVGIDDGVCNTLPVEETESRK